MYLTKEMHNKLTDDVIGKKTRIMHKAWRSATPWRCEEVIIKKYLVKSRWPVNDPVVYYWTIRVASPHNPNYIYEVTCFAEDIELFNPAFKEDMAERNRLVKAYKAKEYRKNKKKADMFKSKFNECVEYINKKQSLTLKDWHRVRKHLLPLYIEETDED